MPHATSCVCSCTPKNSRLTRYHNVFSSPPLPMIVVIPTLLPLPLQSQADLGGRGDGGVGTAVAGVFGARERETRMVFKHLPPFSVDMSTRREMNVLREVNPEEMATHHAAVLAVGVRQANAVAALIDLRNANASRIAFENRRRIIAAFSEPGRPNHTGRTEVQASYLPILLALRFDCLLGK